MKTLCAQVHRVNPASSALLGGGCWRWAVTVPWVLGLSPCVLWTHEGEASCFNTSQCWGKSSKQDHVLQAERTPT